MEYTPLLKGDVSSICKRLAMKKKIIRKNNNNHKKYSSEVMYQAILPSTHTSLTRGSTPHLDSGAPMVLFLLSPFSLLGGLLPLLVSNNNLLVLGSHDLEFFSPL